MVVAKITLYVKRLFVMASLACNVAYANTDIKITIFDVPVVKHHDHSFLSIQVAQEPANLFEPAMNNKNHKSHSTKFLNAHRKILSSKIKLAEQRFISGSKAEYMLVVKRHSLFLKFQYTE